RSWTTTVGPTGRLRSHHGRRSGRDGEGGRPGRGGRRGGHYGRGRSGRRRGPRCGRSSGRRSRRSGRRREEQQRVDVAVRVLGVPDAEVEVWDVVLDLAAGPDRADTRALVDRVAAPNARRTKMRQRHRVAVGSLDRHNSATPGDGAGEGDGAARRCQDWLSGRCADLDSPVLARGIRIVAEDELLENRALDGPCPRPRARNDHERRRDHDDQSSPHVFPSLLSKLPTEPPYLGWPSLSTWTTESDRRGACATAP